MKKETRAETIKRLCAEKNISVSYVMRKAGVSANTLDKWQVDPKTFRTWDAIMEVIKKEPVSETAEVTETAEA